MNVRTGRPIQEVFLVAKDIGFAASAERKATLRWYASRAAVRVVIGVLILATFGTSTSVADDTEMTFRLSDQSSVLGVLRSSEEPKYLSIRVSQFDQPLGVATAKVLEGRVAQSVVETRAPADVEEFAFLLEDQSQIIGQVLSWSGDAVVVRCLDLGDITIKLNRISSVTTRDKTLRKILSLSTSPFRFRRENGWTFDGAVMESGEPGAAVVGELELPDRFRVRLRVICKGTPDFEWTLGDRSAGGAGQGGQRVDRRGGSLSRMPTERFVTRMEWFGDSVSLVRSNPSVSDASVFNVRNQQGTLAVDLLCDQSSGRLVAFIAGVLVGDVSLADDQPITRRAFTMINRGNAVQVERLDMFHWDGIVPESVTLPDQYVQLRDGTVLTQPVQQWGNDQFQIGDQWYALSDLSGIKFARDQINEQACEIVLSDGSRLRGQLDGRDDQGHLLIRDRWDTVYPVDPSRVVHFVGGESMTDESASDASVSGDATLLAGQTRLRGRLVAGSDQSIPFGWQTVVAKHPVGIVGQEGIEINFADSAASSANQGGVGFVELRRRDSLPGELLSIDGDALRFQSQICGEIEIKSAEVRRVVIHPVNSPDPTELELLLSVPRRQKESPPTHVLVAKNGDMLRGELLSIDGQDARFDVRQRIHVIDRDQIAQVIWLHAGQDADGNVSEHTVQTIGGARLGIGTAKLVSGQNQKTELVATHPIFGSCRIPVGSLDRMWFGSPTGDESETEPKWQLIPVKEPKTFE